MSVSVWRMKLLTALICDSDDGGFGVDGNNSKDEKSYICTLTQSHIMYSNRQRFEPSRIFVVRSKFLKMVTTHPYIIAPS